MSAKTLKCPECGSKQFSVNKRGWEPMRGLVGANKLMVTCLNCGTKWEAGTLGDYKCKDCKKVFLTQNTLNKHRLIGECEK